MKIKFKEPTTKTVFAIAREQETKARAEQAEQRRRRKWLRSIGCKASDSPEVVGKKVIAHLDAWEAEKKQAVKAAKAKVRSTAKAIEPKPGRTLSKQEMSKVFGELIVAFCREMPMLKSTVSFRSKVFGSYPLAG